MERPGFQDGEKCGACGGPLEDDRSAVCHTCVPESVWFDWCAAAEAEDPGLKGTPNA